MPVIATVTPKIVEGDREREGERERKKKEGRGRKEEERENVKAPTKKLQKLF